MEGVLLDPGQLARAAVDIASDKKASDVILLDIRGQSAPSRGRCRTRLDSARFWGCCRTHLWAKGTRILPARTPLE